VIDHVMQAA